MGAARQPLPRAGAAAAPRVPVEYRFPFQFFARFLEHFHRPIGPVCFGLVEIDRSGPGHQRSSACLGARLTPNLGLGFPPHRGWSQQGAPSVRRRPRPAFDTQEPGESTRASKNRRTQPDCLPPPTRWRSPSGSGPGRPSFGIDRFDTHQTHQPQNPFAVAAKYFAHLTAAIEGRLEILLVNRSHQGQILGRFATYRVVPAGPRQPHELALASDVQFGMFGIDVLTQFLSRVGQIFLTTRLPFSIGQSAHRVLPCPPRIPPFGFARRQTAPVPPRATASSRP